MSLWQDNCHSSPTNSYTVLVCSGATRMIGEVSAVQWKLCKETKVSSLPTSDSRLVYSSLAGEKCIFAFWYVWHSSPKGAPLQREHVGFLCMTNWLQWERNIKYAFLVLYFVEAQAAKLSWIYLVWRTPKGTTTTLSGTKPSRCTTGSTCATLWGATSDIREFSTFSFTGDNFAVKVV